MKILFIANNNLTDSGMSGSDRIFIELAKRWKDKVELIIVGSEEAVAFSKNAGINSGVSFIQSSRKLGLKNIFALSTLFLNFFIKLFFGSLFVVKKRKLFKDCDCIYSVSDFYPDSVPAFLLKLFYPEIKWIAGFYLFASAPWKNNNPYKGKDLLRGTLYWLSQQPIYCLINRHADIVFLTSEPDKDKFITKKRDESKIIVIRGGVNIADSTEYLNSHNIIPVEQRKYDACFIGRFHYQKGILILMDIWKKVVQNKPEVKLAVIGNGSLEKDVLQKAKRLRIENNVDFFGFVDGIEKFNIFKQSKIILHPATFDSGGMAAAEAMAWGLPGISFNLESLKTYYPKGMIKTECFNLSEFANNIIKLLSNNELYNQLSKEAMELIKEKWDWNRQSEIIYNRITKMIDS